MAMAAAYDLTQALLHPSPASAICPLSDSQTSALRELASIFSNITVLQTNNVNDSSHSLPRVPNASEVMMTSDPRVDSNSSSNGSHSFPRVPSASDLIYTNDPKVDNTLPVKIDPKPSDPTMGDKPEMTCDPSVRLSEPLATVLGEPLIRPLTTNVAI